MTTPVTIRSTSATSGQTHVHIAIGGTVSSVPGDAPQDGPKGPRVEPVDPTLPSGFFALGQGSYLRVTGNTLLLLVRTGTLDWTDGDFTARSMVDLPVDDPQDLLVACRRDPGKYRVGRLEFGAGHVSPDAGDVRYVMQGDNGALAWARRDSDGTETWVVQPAFDDATEFRAQPQNNATADWGADALAAIGADAIVLAGRLVLEDLL